MQAYISNEVSLQLDALKAGLVNGVADLQSMPRPAKMASVCQLDEEKLYLVALSAIEKLGPVKGRLLLQRYESAKNIFSLTKKEIQQIEGVSLHQKNELLKRSTVAAAEKELQFAEKHQLEILTVMSERYPELLREIHDHPLVLFQRGAISLNKYPSIAIVGTRKPSQEGEATTQAFAEAFAASGFNVISGLAYGVDAWAHKSALRVGGLTTAVLGHGLGQIYPREHGALGRNILDSGGGLLTEFCSHVGPDAFNFPARNRIISGLSHATLVIEAQEKGGALITAKMAFDQNRFVYAIPGGIKQLTSVGCNHLIRDQIAKLVLSPEEIIEDLRAVLALGSSRTPASGMEGQSSIVGTATNSKRWSEPAVTDRPNEFERALLQGSVKPQEIINQMLSHQLQDVHLERKVCA